MITKSESIAIWRTSFVIVGYSIFQYYKWRLYWRDKIKIVQSELNDLKYQTRSLQVLMMIMNWLRLMVGWLLYFLLVLDGTRCGFWLIIPKHWTFHQSWRKKPQIQGGSIRNSLTVNLKTHHQRRKYIRFRFTSSPLQYRQCQGLQGFPSQIVWIPQLPAWRKSIMVRIIKISNAF